MGISLMGVAAPARADVAASTFTLANGLRVVIAPVRDAPAVNVGVLYKAGSRDELPSTTGVAHQVEHMMFKGTTDLLAPGDVDRRFYANNAYTTQDETYFYESFRRDALAGALEVEGDRMLNAAIDPTQLILENAVVMTELEGLADDPQQVLEQKVAAAAISVNQYRWPEAGWMGVVRTFAKRRDAVYDFYIRHYAPQNAVLVIAGDVDEEATSALVHRYFDGVPQRPVAPFLPAVEPPQAGERSVAIKGGGPSNRIELAYRVPGGLSDDAYALAVADAVLASGQSSRLYQSLVEDGYAGDLSTTPNGAVDSFLYTVEAPLEDGVSFARAQSVIESEIARLGRAPISAHELARAKKQVVTAWVLSHDGVDKLAEYLAYWEAWSGDWRNGERYVARINAVTADQVRAVARRYLRHEDLTVGTYTALARAPAAQARGSRGRTSPRQSHYHAAAEDNRNGSIEAGSGPRRIVLSNGLVLIVQENHANPSAAIRISVEAGSAFDAPGKSGTAALTQEMLLRGTSARPYDRLQEALDDLGIGVSTPIGPSRADFNTRCLSADVPAVFAILADILQHPRFDPEDFRRAREQLAAQARDDALDPKSAARTALYATLYPKSSAWSLPSEGTARGLAAVQLSDVRRSYANNYWPNNTLIVIVGDVDASRIAADVGRLFGGWRRGQKARHLDLGAPVCAVRTCSNVTRVRRTIAGSKQVEAYVGAGGVSKAAPDYEAAQLMNFILGSGSFTSRLLHEVRETRGLVYDVGSGFSAAADGAGPWVADFAADPKNARAAIDEIGSVVRLLQQGGVSEDELAQARRLAVDAAITSALDDAGMAGQLRDDELLGLGLDYPRRLPDIYAAITPAQIQAAARKYLHPDSWTISTAGPKF